jgi:predicted nuclease with TOPRIM domain
MILSGRRDAMLDTDLEGLGPKEASQYVLAFITTLKQTEKALLAAGEDVALWRRRVALAQSKENAELTAQAQARLAEAEAKEAKLKAEMEDLRAKVSVMKEKLVRIRMTGARLVDTDLLLAQLEMLAGKKDELAGTMKSMEANASLEELKKKMSG